MTLAHILPTLMFVTSAACLSPATAQTGATAASKEVTAGTVQLTGFVELYSEEGVQLLSGGREVTLIGETGQAVPFGGSKVQVTGRFICEKVFRVESVRRVPERVVAKRAETR